MRRFGPKPAASSCSKMRVQKPDLLDHFVCAGDERRRHVEAERVGGLEVDHQLEFRRQLHGQVGRPRSLEDAVNVSAGLPILGDEIDPVGQQPAGGGEEPIRVDRRQAMPGGERGDRLVMVRAERFRRHDEAVAGERLQRLH